MRVRKSLKIILALLALLLLAAMLLPWKDFAQVKLIEAIEKKGIRPVELKIDSLTLKGIALKEVALGEPPLRLAQVTVGYQWRALLNGNIEDVELKGVAFTALRTEKGWKISGLGELLAQPAGEKATPAHIPTSNADLAIFPLRKLRIEEGEVNVQASGWQATLPATIEILKGEKNSIHLESAGLQAKKGAISLTSGKAVVDLTLDTEKNEWNGNWSIDQLAYNDETMSLPPQQAKGTLRLTGDEIQLNGSSGDSSRAYRSAFRVKYPLNKPESAAATIESASMPWGQGTIAVRRANIPLSGNKSITLNLEVQKVAIDVLMQTLTGNKASGTGVVSGSFPLTITSAGQLRIGKGTLKAEQPGTISLSPEAIPGDNAQVALVRDVLKNLHYTLLSLELGMEGDNMLSATLAVDGRNPDVEQGRPIKLKVHLSGDLLNLILQNVKLMTDPKNFIRQATHDKNN